MRVAMKPFATDEKNIDLPERPITSSLAPALVKTEKATSERYEKRSVGKIVDMFPQVLSERVVCPDIPAQLDADLSISVPETTHTQDKTESRSFFPLTHQTLQQLVNDTPGYHLPPRPPPKEDQSNSDIASVNTRNELWSISSFHTRCPPEDSDKASNSPPPDLAPDFELPLDCLLKPMKKSTFAPVPQEETTRFLEMATWQLTTSTPPTAETLWTAKNLPLQPVELGGGKSVASHDPFLESIESSKRNDVHAQFRETRRRRVNQYPGRETTYTQYMKEDRDSGYTETQWTFVRRISTQSTNPPDRYPRQRRQSEMIEQPEVVKHETVDKPDVVKRQTEPDVKHDSVVQKLVLPPIHKVYFSRC
jgi:hypothetical protein